MSRDKALDAIHAVLDIHHDTPDYGWCRECVGKHFAYPCPTVQAIQDALGEDRQP